MEHSHLIPIRVFFLSLLLFIPWLSFAADISGFVRNANNQPIPGAKVTYTCTGKNYSVTTNKYGRYRVTGLPNVKWCTIKVNDKAMPNKINSGSGSKEVDLRV